MSYIDAAVRPQDDLSRYVNGRWFATTEIPADKPSYGAGSKIYDDTQSQLRGIVEKASGEKHQRANAGQRIGDLYKSFIDEARLEMLGVRPLAAEFARIDAIRTKHEVATQIAPKWGGIKADRHKIPADIHKIKHVVVLMQENRSFDHYFGWRADVDGSQNQIYLDPSGSPVNTHYAGDMGAAEWQGGHVGSARHKPLDHLSTLLDDPRIHDVAASLLGDDFNYMGSDGNFYAGDTRWHSDGYGGRGGLRAGATGAAQVRSEAGPGGRAARGTRAGASQTALL